MRWRSIAVSMVVAATAVGCSGEPRLLREMRKEQLIDEIRDQLLESVVAEKSAVLATTDEESKAMALESQGDAADINRLRGELRQLIVTDGRRDEIEKLEAFDTTWADLEGVDQRLLALAVRNSNLKAAQLSTRVGTAALDRFVDGVTVLERATSEPDTLRTLSGGVVAALRMQSLLLVHIPAADDAEMTLLEQQMRDLGEQVDGSLAATRASGGPSPEQIAAASQAWSDYQRISADVVKLSRENSDVIAFDVSVHEKRQATKACLAALSALLDAIKSGPRATR